MKTRPALSIVYTVCTIAHATAKVFNLRGFCEYFTCLRTNVLKSKTPLRTNVLNEQSEQAAVQSLYRCT